ncbi:MAG: hypothetical protein ACE5KV_08395 [Thermoplasmata archaeon]
MLILKNVEYDIRDIAQLESLLGRLHKTTSQVEGVEYKDIYFVRGKREFVLFLECESEEKYLEWREICPLPPGARDWYEILLAKSEYFSKLDIFHTIRAKAWPTIVRIPPQPAQNALGSCRQLR